MRGQVEALERALAEHSTWVVLWIIASIERIVSPQPIHCQRNGHLNDGHAAPT
ncbi:MAG TPA: hypothetical protein PKN82_14295 [Thauera sp.]|nr:hypothetical protein [Thauera sp.]